MNKIHATAVVEQDVIMGDNNYIGPFCYIKSGTIIGSNNRFEAYCCIGTPPQDRDVMYNSDGQPVIIGDSNVFREYVQVNNGVYGNTKIGNNNLLLINVHISHDSVLENNITIANNTVLGGYSYLMVGCNIAIGCILHQYSVIGAYSMLGMGTIVTKTSVIDSGNIYIGSPASFLKENSVGLKRFGITNGELQQEIHRYHEIKNKNNNEKGRFI